MAKVPAKKLNDGGKIPQLGLGVWQVPDEQAADSVKEALAAGYRSVDTAAIYGNEAGVGAGLRASGVGRKDLFITTKLWNDQHGYDDAHKAMDESLEKLGLAYVDLYLIHWPVAGSERFLDTWRAMVEMKEDGRARSIGVSNFTQANLERLIDASGVAALSQMIARCKRQGTKVILSGLREQPRRILAQMGVAEDGGTLQFARDFAESVLLAARDTA